MGEISLNEYEPVTQFTLFDTDAAKKQAGESVRLLIIFPHGIGDCVQATVVLKHLRKYRPLWTVHVKAGYGKHTAFIGHCAKVFHDKEPAPSPDDYTVHLTPGFWENQSRYIDRPNSKITNCLADVFGISYDPSLGRYEIEQPQDKFGLAAWYLASIGCQLKNGKFNAVVIQYQGNTVPERKDLAHWQAHALCELAIRAGRVPIILDWDKRSPLPDNKRIFCPGVGPNDIWGNFGSGDAATIACLIQQAEAFIGIDSGPGKIASSTDTPSLICWTGHHPLQFHDPAPNTTHLIPSRHKFMVPIEGNVRRLEYFERAYHWLCYLDSPQSLTWQACRWLGEILGVQVDAPTVQYVLPTGIGDSVWALHKIRAINEAENHGEPIDVILSGDSASEVDRRSLSFLKRFSFIRSVQVQDVPVLRDLNNPTDAQGRYRYQPDGRQGHHHYLIPNATLEQGIRIEEWLEDYEVDWSVMNAFSFKGTEHGQMAAKKLGKFVAFYLGPMAGNTTEGHNRGPIWTPEDWGELAKYFTSRGCKIAIVGAPYDRSYYETFILPIFVGLGIPFVDLIGAFPDIGDTFSLLRGASCVCSYQCGLGIVSALFGVPTAMWWRPDGDSIHSFRKVCFDERMASAWVNPTYRDRYLVLIYGRDTAAGVIAKIEVKKWVW